MREAERLFKKTPKKKKVEYEEVPAEMRDYVKMLLSTAPDLRPTTEQIQQLPYFEDFGVKTLTNLDSQFQWDNLQKSQFYKANL